MRWLVFPLAALVMGACFFPWVEIETKHIVISGFRSGVGDYGQPGILHIVFCSFCLLFILLRRPWSVRTAFFISAFNIAWAVRNYIIVSACRGGICPAKQPALYILVAASLLLPVLTLAVRLPAAKGQP
jgi:hypothetical protein